MAITRNTIKALQVEIQRCKAAADRAMEALHEQPRNDFPLITGRKETGALRRASMDLTRALAELRRTS